MEIRIKTHEEFQANHLTIEITGTDAEVRQVADGHGPGGVWEKYQKATSRIAELEHTLAGAINRESRLEEKLNATKNRVETVTGHRTQAENKVRDLEQKVQSYDTDRHTERDRADRERQRASELKDRLSSSEERVKELEDRLGHRDRARDELNRRMLMNGRETARKLAQSQDLATRAGADRDLAVKRVKELEDDLHRSEQSVRARDNLLGAATLKIEQAQEILHNPELEEVLERTAMRGITIIETAIRDASNTLA